MRWITAVLALAAASCNTSSSLEPDDRPGENNDIETDDQIELTDDAMRITGASVSLVYDDGGVIFSEENSGLVSAIRLADGFKVEFDPNAGKLYVNGSEIRLKSSELVKTDGGCRWYKLIVEADGFPIFIVLNDL